jgi:hypothetical protein
MPKTMWATSRERDEHFRSETLSTEDYDAYLHDLEQQARYEIEAENAWLRVAEAGTPEDYAFDQWEHDMGLVA